MPFPLGEASAEPFFAGVFAGALNTESCRVCRTLAHFGHAILVFLASTICSYRAPQSRSEEHTSELQSHLNLVCRLLLEKKKHEHRNRKDVKHRDALKHANKMIVIVETTNWCKQAGVDDRRVDDERDDMLDRVSSPDRSC